MRKRTPLPLLAWCLAVLVLLQPLQALALSVTQGQTFGIPISLNSDEPFSELQISFGALEGLSFQGTSGSMSHLGNGAFRSDTPITSGTITLNYRANDDAGPEQAVMVEGVIASSGEGEQRRYWGVGPSFRSEVHVAPAPPEEVWPETWTIVTPATCEAQGLRQRSSNLGKAQEEVIPALGHDYGEWTLVRAATLDAVGLEQRVCKHDPAHIESRELPKLTQAWTDWMVVSMPTCELPGKEERVSIHDASIKESREIAALGHDYGEWALVRAATLDAVGVPAVSGDPVGAAVPPSLPPVWGPIALRTEGQDNQSLSGTNSYGCSSSLAARSCSSAYSVSNPVYSSLGTASLSSSSGTNTSTTVSAGGSFGTSQPSPSALSIPELQATNQQLSERIQQRYQALGPDPSQEDLLLLQVELTKLYMQIETATLQYKLAQSMQGIIQKM